MKIMSSAVLKNKINKSLAAIDDIHLKSAYIILRELVNQQKLGKPGITQQLVDTKIEQGIHQLEKAATSGHFK